MENKDPLKFQMMADAQKERRNAINKARTEASPYLLSLREAAQLFEQMQKEGKA